MINRIRACGRHGLVWMLAAWPSVVLAQGPVEAGELKSETPYLPWAIGVGILAAVLVVCFMNPKRAPN